MPEPLLIVPATAPLNACVRPPGSKSITNRALVCASLAAGKSTLTGALQSDDTQVMITGLQQLGITIDTQNDGETLLVTGASGQLPALEANLFCANSGTTIRFLTAVATLGHGPFRLDGVPRMRQRPIGDLVDALRQLGAEVTSERNNDCPPVTIHANGLIGGTARIRGNISSQFLSGLLMAAPAANAPVELQIEGPLVSIPYVEMTLTVMKAFGVTVTHDESFQQFSIAAPTPYQPCQLGIEPDASAASYFWAAAAIVGGEVLVEGLTPKSLQGDVAFVDALEQMGCEVRHTPNSMTVVGGPLQGIEIDMNGISDTVQTLAVVALFARGPTTIRGVGHIRHKETDRIGNLAVELRKLGAGVDEHEDGLTVHPGPLKAATLDTYEDHRMAMSFALAGLRIEGVRIHDPGCTAKTYPHYFDDLQMAVR
jgi:3-phosphoshikimate 1-carboxyvinyltransferase